MAGTHIEIGWFVAFFDICYLLNHATTLPPGLESPGSLSNGMLSTLSNVETFSKFGSDHQQFSGAHI